MQVRLLHSLLLVVLFTFCVQAQELVVPENSGLLSETERAEFKAGKAQEHVHSDAEYIFVPATQRLGGTCNTQVVPQCSNMNFESGNFSNWTLSNGYNPLFNAIGCCTFTNQLDITLMSGAGLDPYGGFPVVYPGGGNYSARIGSAAVGGRADRLEQTFSVSATNPILKINYAAVVYDGGHTLASQPRITFELLDSLGNQIPCTFLNVSTGSNLPWSTSTASVNILYTNWRSHLVNLSQFINQTVVLRATAYDCGPSGHYAYTYLDVECLPSLPSLSTSTMICQTTNTTSPPNLCSPYPSPYPLWMVPQSTVPVTQNCILATSAGVYTFYPDGCALSANSAITFSVSFYPTVQITKTISDTVSCNTTISFSATALSGTSTVNGTWYFGDSTSTANNLAIHSYSSLGNHTAKFVAQNSFGCRDSVKQLIRLLALPTANFLSDTVCEGMALTFTNLSSSNQGTIQSSQWVTSSASLTTSGVPATQSFTLPAGSYPFSLTVNSGYNCTSSITKNALVLLKPQVSIVMQPSYCAGSTITYSYSTGTAGAAIAASSWTLPLLVLSSTPSTTQQIYTAGIYTANLAVSSASGCIDTKQFSFSVFPLPTVAITGGSICAGNSFTLVPSGAFQYLVSGNNYVVAPTVSTTYSLLGTSAQGCLSANVATAVVNVVPLPTISISSGSICSGSSFALLPTGASNYTLSGNNVVVSPSVTTVYTLSGQNSAGCYANSPVFSTVVVNPIPNVSLNSGSVCLGAIYTLQAQGAQQYTYSIASPSFQVISSGVYSVVGSNSYGCINTATALVTALPKPTIFLQQNKYSVCENEVVTFTAFGAPNYSWSIGGTSATNSVLASLTSTTMFAIGSNSFGCSDTAYAYINVNALPSLSIVMQPTEFCRGENYTLTASGAQNYFWPPISNSATYTASAAALVSKTVTGTSAFGCKSEKSFVYEPELCTGIYEQNILTTFSYALQNQVLQVKSDCATIVELYDACGKKIIGSNSSPEKTTYFTIELASGVYVLIVYCEDQRHVKKILINGNY